jgi:hypothetical protein
MSDLALNKAAFQSSIPLDGETKFGPQNAVDGDGNTACHKSGCAVTLSDTNPWWAVDLAGVYQVIAVELRNRGDSSALETANFTVGVTNVSPNDTHPTLYNYQICGQWYGTPSRGQLCHVDCKTDIQPGRFVIIQRPATGRLVIAAVHVYGRSPDELRRCNCSSVEIDAIRKQQTHMEGQLNQIQQAVSNLTADKKGDFVIIQNHFKGELFFNRSWEDFKLGFGNANGNYWIGNEKLHKLTTKGNRRLRIDVQSKYDGQWYWAEYTEFVIDSEVDGYALHVGNYTGNAGDCINTQQYGGSNFINGAKFTTYDHENDKDSAENCALILLGGFWYNKCTGALINSPDKRSTFGFSWWCLPLDVPPSIRTRSLLASRMSLM